MLSRKAIVPSLLALLSITGPSASWAHAVAAAAQNRDSSELLGVVLPLLITAALYAVGTWRLHRRSQGGSRARLKHLIAFIIGWLALAAALLPPIDTLGGELFAFHMIQHEIMMLIAAPLLVLGRPLPVFLWAFPSGTRAVLARAAQTRSIAEVWRMLTHPLCAWGLHALALWAWHAPRVFEAALTNQGVHDFQHLSFLGTALLFWSALFHARARESQGAAILYLFTTTVHSGVLGALITFGAHPWYPAYLYTAPAWGFSALEDQQLGGLIMWVPASLVYVGVALSLLARWINAPSRSLEARIQ
jgi:putative membrane protein